MTPRTSETAHAEAESGIRATRAAVRAAYETIAESYAASRREPWPPVLSFIATLKPASRILDVGCGHGRHLAPLADTGHRATGLDFSRGLLSIGRREVQASGRRAAWVVGDAVALPFRDEAFDACLAVAVLHHLPTRADRLAVVCEIRRVLVPGGAAFLSVWDLEGSRFRTVRARVRQRPEAVRGDVEIPWPVPGGRPVPRYYHLFQEGELESLIIESGLDGETFFRASGNRYALARRHG